MRRLLATPIAIVAVAVVVAVLGVASSQADSAKPKVTAAGHAFTPEKLNVSVGATVVWKQVSGTHTVTFKEGGFDQPLDPDHPKVKATFPAGTYHYFCQFHVDKGMKGKVVVK
jgi:plastocyanin